MPGFENIQSSQLNTNYILAWQSCNIVTWWQNMRAKLTTTQIHTMRTDIVSVLKHTDSEAALVSATFQLKLFRKSTRCCRTLLGFGDYNMRSNGTIWTEENQQQTSERKHRSDSEASSLDFQTCSLLRSSRFVSGPQRQYGASAVNAL